MNSLLSLVMHSITLLFLQNPPADEGVPYTPQDAGPGWLLIGAVILVLAVVVFVLLKVFRGLQRSRESEVAEESKDSAQAPKR